MKKKRIWSYYQSPIGWIKIVIDNEQLISLSFIDKNVNNDFVQITNNIIIHDATEQLKKYFENSLQEFNLPLAIKGTAFQELVWSETFKIPYGTTITYQQLAQKINKPKAARAVGSALAKNPLAIIIPCHRVVNSNNNKVVNYFWGRKRKLFLQSLESKKDFL